MTQPITTRETAQTTQPVLAPTPNSELRSPNSEPRTPISESPPPPGAPLFNTQTTGPESSAGRVHPLPLPVIPPEKSAPAGLPILELRTPNSETPDPNSELRTPISESLQNPQPQPEAIRHSSADGMLSQADHTLPVPSAHSQMEPPAGLPLSEPRTPISETPDPNSDLRSPISDPQTSPLQSETNRLREAHRREQLIETVEALKATGLSERKACEQAGVDAATYIRYRRAYAVGGFTALLPQTDRRGRKRDQDPLTILELKEARERLEEIYVATLAASSGPAARGRRTGKIATTLWLFGHESVCPETLAAKLRNNAKPLALVRYLKRITPEKEALIRGEKHAQLYGLISKRDQTFRLPDGRRARNVAGAIWEFDDMSVNQPFFWESAGANGQPETMISRQGLYARDVRTGRWLGVELIARPREAYRAEDILRFFRRLFELYGKPRLIRLEKSVWAARSIKGATIKQGEGVEEMWDRLEMPLEERQKLQDGLSACGVRIQYCAHAHLKVIECAFEQLQTVLATRTRDFVNIGRHAGEFEHGAKQLRRVRAESHHPRDVGFAPMHTLADRIEETFGLLNSRPTQRLEQRTPDQVWDDEIKQYPPRTMMAEDLAVFLPEVREITIKGGAIWPACNGETVEFRAEIFADLGDGYKVWARFDPMEPSLGAAIYNRESGARAFLGHVKGEMIAFASYVVPGPQGQMTAEEAAGLPTQTIEEMYGPGVIDSGDAIRKKQDRRLRTEFRALPRPGQPSVKASTTRDAGGRVTRIETNGQHTPAPQVLVAGQPAPAPAPEPAPATPNRTRTMPAPTRHMFDVPVTDDKSRELTRRLARIARSQRDGETTPASAEAYESTP